VLKDCTKTLLFRERGGPIVGVSAFDRQEIALTDRRRVPGWRLQVIALERSWRGVLVGAELPGCDDAMKASEYVLRKTYERMLALDRRRAIVVAKVHDDNVASMRATARVGLFRTRRVDDFYWEMLGEVDPAIRPE
jgi:hypothetical protein